MSSNTLDKEIEAVDHFTFEVIDSPVKLKPFISFVEIKNEKKGIVVFKGRIITPNESMNEDGTFDGSYSAEGALAYLDDTHPPYQMWTDWTAQRRLNQLVALHNERCEPYKQFGLNMSDITPKVPKSDTEEYDDTAYFITDPEKSILQNIRELILAPYGGEMYVDYYGSLPVLVWCNKIGSKKDTQIKIGKNMKSFHREIDATEVITRLIPLGSSEETAWGGSKRLEISEDPRSGGKNYIDIPELQAIYGIQTGTAIFDDEYTPDTLYDRAQQEVIEIKKKYAKMTTEIALLDLYTIGLDPDEFERGNTHRTILPKYGIDEDLRIIGTSFDVTMPQNKSIRIGEKELSILDVSDYNTVNIIKNTVPTIIKDEVGPVIENVVNEIHTDISTAESKAVTDADELARQRVQKFIDDSYTPFKLSIPDLMNAKLSDFKEGELAGIISNTIKTNGESIKNDVVTRINTGTNVIRGDAIVVDAAMISKIAADQTFTDKLVATDAFISNIMASNIVTDKIKATDIDLNRATISGAVDSKNYVVLTSDYIRQYGNYAATNIDGEDVYVEGYTEFRNGRIRIRNDISNSSLYYCHDGVFTNVLNKIDSTAGISFSDKTFGSMGMYLFSSGGGIGVNAFDGTLMLAGDKTRLIGDSSLTLESTNSAIRFQPLENLRNGTNTFELWVQPGAASSTDGNLLYGNIAGDNTVGSGIRFYKNGAIVEATNHKGDKGTGKFRGTAFENSSWIEYKQDITSWEYDALSVILNELDLYQYKYKADTSTYHRGVIIGDGYSVPPEFVSGEAVNLYEMIVWSLRAIQQLGHKNNELENRIKVLEDKINGTTETTETTT